MPTMKKYILPFILLLSLLLTACGAQPSGGEEAPWQPPSGRPGSTCWRRTPHPPAP